MWRSVEEWREGVEKEGGEGKREGGGGGRRGRGGERVRREGGDKSLVKGHAHAVTQTQEEYTVHKHILIHKHRYMHKTDTFTSTITQHPFHPGWQTHIHCTKHCLL